MEFLDPRSYRDDRGIGYYFGEDFEGIRKATSLQKEIRDKLVKASIPGTTTKKLNTLASRLIKEAGAEPLFLGYGGFPCTICTSVNDEVVHGLARKDKLKTGDVLSIDLGVRLNGFCGDSARTIIIGSKQRKDSDTLIVQIAEKAFKSGVAKAYPGNSIGDIGHAILKEIMTPRNSTGQPIFDIYKDFMGHGIGHELHEKPLVFNYGIEGNGHTIKEGMCICIEPVVIHKTSKVIRGGDIFTFKTSDRKTASHYENQVYIDKNGPIILT